MEGSDRKRVAPAKREPSAERSRQFRAFLVQWARRHMSERVRFKLR